MEKGNLIIAQAVKSKEVKLKSHVIIIDFITPKNSDIGEGVFFVLFERIDVFNY